MSFDYEQEHRLAPEQEQERALFLVVLSNAVLMLNEVVLVIVSIAVCRARSNAEFRLRVGAPAGA